MSLTGVAGAAAHGSQLVLHTPQSSQLEDQIESAQKHIEERQFGKALEVLDPLVRSEGKPPPEVFMLRATCYLNLKQTDQALESCERGMALHPQDDVMKDFYVTVLRGYVPVQDMKAKLNRALESAPRSRVLLRALAFVELHLDHRSGQARQVVEKYVQLAPNDPNSHYVYGRWAVLNHKEALAVEEWEKTLALVEKPDAQMQMDVYTLIGDAESALERPERAEAAFQKALRANTSLPEPNPASAFFYAEFLAKQSRFEESQKILDQVLTWAPNYGPALLQRATYLSRQNKHNEAIMAAQAALDGTDLSPDRMKAAHVLLAKSHFALGRVEEARRHQEWLQRAEH